MDLSEVSLLCKALSDLNRLRIIQCLTCGEQCGCELLEQMRITQPTLSHHMKILCDAGLVLGRKEGKWNHYSFCCEGVHRIRGLMKELLSVENLPKDCDCKKG